MAQTFIVKGDVVTNPSANTFGNAHFVRITATGDVTGTVLDSSDTQLGQFYLEDGDTVIIEKTGLSIPTFLKVKERKKKKEYNLTKKQIHLINYFP